MITEKKLNDFYELKKQNPNLNIVSLVSKTDLVDSLDGRARTIVVHKLFDSDLCTIKDLIDGYKEKMILESLISRQKIFKELIQNNKLTQEDLRYLLNTIDKWDESQSLSENTSLLKYIVDKNIVSFQELVDKVKSIKDEDNDPSLYRLLENKKFFKELIQNNRLSKEDLRYLLNSIDDIFELYKLCDNTSLLKKILNEFVLDRGNVDKFNTITENSSRCKDENIHNIFDYIEYHNKNNEEVLKLNKLNRKIYLLNSFDLNEDQRLELAEILKDSEVAQNRLIQIVESNLQDQYNSDTLKKILTKDDKKKKIKFNL